MEPKTVTLLWANGQVIGQAKITKITKVILWQGRVFVKYDDTLIYIEASIQCLSFQEVSL